MTKGYYYDKRRNKYVARMRDDGRGVYLGAYDTPEEAAAAYERAQQERAAERDINPERCTVEQNRASLAYWFFSRGRLTRDGNLMKLLEDA